MHFISLVAFSAAIPVHEVPVHTIQKMAKVGVNVIQDMHVPGTSLKPRMNEFNPQTLREVGSGFISPTSFSNLHNRETGRKVNSVLQGRKDIRSSLDVMRSHLEKNRETGYIHVSSRPDTMNSGNIISPPSLSFHANSAKNGRLSNPTLSSSEWGKIVLPHLPEGRPLPAPPALFNIKKHNLHDARISPLVPAKKAIKTIKYGLGSKGIPRSASYQDQIRHAAILASLKNDRSNLA